MDACATLPNDNPARILTSNDIISRQQSVSDDLTLTDIESSNAPSEIDSVLHNADFHMDSSGLASEAELARQKDFQKELDNLVTSEVTRLQTNTKSLITAVHVSECSAFVLKADVAMLESQNARLERQLETIPIMNKRITELDSEIREAKRARSVEFRVGTGVSDRDVLVWDDELSALVKDSVSYQGLMKELKEMEGVCGVGGVGDGMSSYEWVLDKLEEFKRRRDGGRDYRVGGRFFKPSIAFDGRDLAVPNLRSAAVLDSGVSKHDFVILQTLCVLSTARGAELKLEYEVLQKQQAQKEEKYKRLLELSSNGSLVGKRRPQ
ncbi:hypothetical protein BDR26DRAFT_871313 [Obelidium mucronatum]|nr:hypothetical protein BDR26DRAFT_871313 [Obelidium mucronatum]